MKHFVFGFSFGLACVSWAATDLEGGGINLTSEEVANTRALFSEMQWKMMEQGNRINELERQVEFYRTSRCT